MQTLLKRSHSTKESEIKRSWHVVDARDVVLGRLASEVANVLRGKTKPYYAPHLDCGDFVVVINAAHVRLTGNKLMDKIYYRHSGFLGGIKEINAKDLLAKHPTRLITNAVRGMLPKGPLGRAMLTKLKVYADAQHPHQAQQPQPWNLDARS